MPSLTSGWPNFAFSLAMRMWHAIASSQPPPSAYPFTAAITGLPHVSRRRSIAWPRSARALPSNGPCLARSPMSAPATNAFVPAPVRIAPLIASSLAMRSAACASSSTTWSFRALSLSGRLMVMNAMASRISNRRVSYRMGRMVQRKRGSRNAERGTSARGSARLFRVPRSTFRVMFRSMSIQAIAWSPSGAVRIVDQRALPEARIERDLESAEAVAEAIRTLQVRGAPLIGIAAAMGLVAGTRELRSASRQEFVGRLGRLAELLAAARPTAVNLRWALERMTRRATATPGDGVALWERLHAEATAIWEEDRAMCRRIGEAGLPLVPDGATVLTHCNAGALATGGIGTALAPIYLAHEAGRRLHVFVDETRPVLQGARLTAWELSHAGIPCTLIADAVAGRPVAPAAVVALNPAFDVTPARYVTGYLTDRGLRQPPFGAD